MKKDFLVKFLKTVGFCSIIFLFLENLLNILQEIDTDGEEEDVDELSRKLDSMNVMNELNDSDNEQPSSLSIAEMVKQSKEKEEVKEEMKDEVKEKVKEEK